MNWKYKVDSPIRDLAEIRSRAKDIVDKSGPFKVAVAVGEDLNGLEGLALGLENGMIEPVLIGHRRHINEAFDKLKLSRKLWAIHAEKDHIPATQKAVEMVKSGQASILMRGRLLARDFFRALLDPRLELKDKDSLWSNIVVIEHEKLDRLLMLTDCAVVVNSDLVGRLKLIQNAIAFAGFLGITEPKVALLAAVESISPGMPVSLDEAVIAKMWERGQFPRGVSIDGPLSLDLAINPESVRKKNISSPVAGQADILVLNNIGIGNLLFKSLITLCGAGSASTIVGMPFPTVLTSRSEEPENILYSLALAILMVGREK